MAHAQDYKQTDYGIKASIATKSTDVEIQWFSPQTVRVLKTPINATIDKKSLSVIASPQKNSATVKQDGNTIIMESKKIRVNVDLKSRMVSFCTKDGSQLLSETENNKAFTPFNDAGRKTYSIYQGYDTNDNEALHGLVQLQKWQDEPTRHTQSPRTRQPRRCNTLLPIYKRVWHFLGQLLCHYLRRHKRRNFILFRGRRLHRLLLHVRRFG